MDEPRDPKSALNVPKGEASGSAGSPKRDEEATSSETLSDLEQSEKSTGAGASSSDTGSSLEGSSPKPTSEGGGRADGSDSGGPM